jgi:hypothetical protein
MTVVYKAGEQTFKAVEVLWAKRELVNAIVEQALISQYPKTNLQLVNNANN